MGILVENPGWVNDILKFSSDSNDFLIDAINKRLSSTIQFTPKVSVVIPAKNEEAAILKCIYSLCMNETVLPFEVIVVDNGSTDDTRLLVSKTKAKLIVQEKKSIGLSREMGQRAAKGEVVLQTDADCLYPRKWIQGMYDSLLNHDIVCVYGRYRFVGDENIPRWKLFLYESMKYLLSELREINRPFLNAYGMNIGYPRELGVQIGFDTRPIRGTDGRLVYELSKRGKIKFLRSDQLVVWAENRALLRKGSFSKNIFKRMKRELSTFRKYFFKIPDHDPKKSIGESC